MNISHYSTLLVLAMGTVIVTAPSGLQTIPVGTQRPSDPEYPAFPIRSPWIHWVQQFQRACVLWRPILDQRWNQPCGDLSLRGPA